MPPSSPNAPPSIPTGPRKRKLAARLADQDNVAEPVLKHQRVALQRHRGAINGSTGDNISDVLGDPPSEQATHRSHRNRRRHLEAGESTSSDSDDAPVEVPAPSSHKRHQPSTQSESISSEESSDILKDFVPKKRGNRRGDSGEAGNETETPEQQRGEPLLAQCAFFARQLNVLVARLMTAWDAPVYAFYEPIPAIEVVGSRRCHVFKCTAVGCTQKIRRFLDTNDKGSTSNLRSHSKKCWGEEAFAKAYEVKNVVHVRAALSKLKSAPNGNIAAIFSNMESKGVVSYMHRQHTAEESR